IFLGNDVLLVSSVIKQIAECKHCLPKSVVGVPQGLPSLNDFLNQGSLLFLTCRKPNLDSFKVFNLGPSAIAMACCDSSKRPLVIAGSQQGGKKRRVKPVVSNLIDGKLIAYQSPIKLLRDYGNATFPQVYPGEDDIARSH